jgi:RHS repeat-associated protein
MPTLATAWTADRLARPAPAAGCATDSLRRLEGWLQAEAGRALEWSADGLLTAVTEADGARSAYRYDARGDLVAIREPDGGLHGYTYDERRRLAQVAHPDGSRTRYQYERDRLAQIDDRGILTRYRYDVAGLLDRVTRGGAGSSVYRYDAAGRVAEARTARVSCGYGYDAQGRVTCISQTINGVMIALRFAFDEQGRLATLVLPDGATVRYRWNERGRPGEVLLNEASLARFSYDDAARQARTRLANGLIETTDADIVDGRPLAHRLTQAGAALFERSYRYDAAGRIVDDGARSYRYDIAGRLAAVVTDDVPATFTYDALDQRISDATMPAATYDPRGRLIRATSGGECISYLYDDADQLIEVRRDGTTAAQFTYDHKGRLAQSECGGRAERYLYGPADELLAVTDEAGVLLRGIIRTPLGSLAEARGAELFFLHHDPRGARVAVSDAAGAIVARFAYDPFGLPQHAPETPGPALHGREWCAEAGLYNMGARWYHPALGGFLTPDSYTAAPDDTRLLDPRLPAEAQSRRRDRMLLDWLKRARARNPRAFCGNDPVNNTDPNGHWSFGGVLLSVLGALWTLPNTLLGIALEITCLIGEVIRWVVSLVSGGSADWESPGFDAAASGRLNAFALVFSGGWLGSFRSLLGITFGNVFFVYKNWRTTPMFNDPRPIHPSAYNGTLELPRAEALYEHELRHTNQYGWFGPFFHLGLPIFGVYEWDVIVNGYEDAWTERDARAHGGIDAADLLPPDLTPPPTLPPAMPTPLATPPAPAAPAAPAPAAPAAPAPAATTIYGNYALRRGDRDDQRRYAGAPRAAPADRVPQAGETPFVEQLQEDLRALGFAVIERADGRFELTTEWAVREFQAYARLAFAAQEASGSSAPALYVDRLSQVAVPEPQRYGGPISGVANDATQRLIRHWVANRWRCPVVICAWRMAGGNRQSITRENIWRHDEVASSGPRMFARDFSGAYTFPASHSASDWNVIGDFQSYMSWSGPRSAPSAHTWPEAELLPEALVGQPLSALSAAQLATYKVVRAASEVECLGFFDSVNSYDNAFVSLGPCHWTLGIVDNPMSEGELCGFLAYLRHADPAAFEQAIGRFGARIDESWVAASGPATGQPNGQHLFSSSQRKYAGWVALQQEDGSYARMALTEAAGNYFKTWHWFYRFVMAGRTIDGFRRRMWHMARIRLRDIRATPWPASAHVPDVPDDSGGTRPAMIGDVYASERAMALLLRWHIRFPGHVISGGHAGTRLVNALGHAAIPAGAGDPSTWTDAHQAALAQGIMDEVAAINNDNLNDTMTYVNTWPSWASGSNPRNFMLPASIGGLATTRTFQLDDSELPPAPY